MRVDSVADLVFFPETPEELISLIYELKSSNTPWRVLGAGSNILPSSQGVKGAVICTTSMDWIKKTSPSTINAGAGVRLPKLAGRACQLELSGCEFYEGIPGSVGGAIIMNAGAHGSQTADILEKVTVFDTKSHEIKTFVPSQLIFEYRSSNIDPDRYIILEAKFRLKDGTKQQIQGTMKKYHQERATKQPRGFSCGCVFKNPSTGSAGKLIDEAGLKGTKVGGAEISDVHANFIINSKGAKSENICEIIRLVQKQIWESKGVWLKPEVKPFGEFNEEDKILWVSPDQRPEDWSEKVGYAM